MLEVLGSRVVGLVLWGHRVLARRCESRAARDAQWARAMLRARLGLLA